MSSSAFHLKSKIKDVLNEARILILGTQVLLGFQFQAYFYPGFSRLADLSQWANLASLVLNLSALCLLLAPAPYHRIAFDGDDTVELKHFAARTIALALPLLAGSLGLDVALISVRTIGDAAAIAIGLATLFAAVIIWIGIALMNRTRTADEVFPELEASSLNEKIQTLL